MALGTGSNAFDVHIPMYKMASTQTRKMQRDYENRSHHQDVLCSRHIGTIYTYTIYELESIEDSKVQEV